MASNCSRPSGGSLESVEGDMAEQQRRTAWARARREETLMKQYPGPHDAQGQSQRIRTPVKPIAFWIRGIASDALLCVSCPRGTLGGHAKQAGKALRLGHLQRTKRSRVLATLQTKNKNIYNNNDIYTR